MEIGRGRFGIAELPNEKKLALMKISPRSKQQGKVELQGEISNLKSLKHENLVQLWDGYSNKDPASAISDVVLTRNRLAGQLVQNLHQSKKLSFFSSK
ncbi:hypothetical protein NC652_024419 [Populus alba x Populus x berolinensis]|nr:hypothetical protein NC652_024419 [Populus alba x Populus x berolinensis]